MVDPPPQIFAIGEKALEGIAERLSRQSGSEGGGVNGLEARMAKLEAAVEHIQSDLGEMKIDMREIRNNARSDFRWMVLAYGTGFMALIGVMAKGFGWL